MGEKQGLESVIDVAEICPHKDYLFVFVGQGGGKKKLEKLVLDKKLVNVIFRPLQPYDKLPALLKLADCHLVIQRRGAADSVLPSKLTNILALGGNAVITAEKNTELGQLCDKYPGIAICIEPESNSALQFGIEECLKQPSFNQQANKYAQESLDKSTILKRFMNALEKKNN
jgi:colanic acid biosynthesis glycosyl transferase WcaI